MAMGKTIVRERRPGSIDVRVRILTIAAKEFAIHGFDGASTRRIAEKSGVYQAQIGYHIGKKDDLWRATVDFLFERLRAHLDAALPINPNEAKNDPVAVLTAMVRQHVHHTTKHPELSRIMLMEAARKSSRVDWLLRVHVRPIFGSLSLLWEEVRATGKVRDMEAEDVFMMMIGLAPMPSAQAGIMRPLLGAYRCTPDQHSQSLMKWIVK